MPSSSNKKNTPQDAADASHSETPAPNTKAVLDSSGDGGPFIPGYTGGWGLAAGLGNAGGAQSSDTDLVVEIELVAGAAPLGAALTTNMADFMAGSESAAPTTDTGLRSILNQYGLKEAQAVFSAEQIKADADQVPVAQYRGVVT